MTQEEAINWSRMSLEELQHYWNAYVEVDLERAGVDLSSRPTYKEITDAGYSGIAYALREHHDMTLTEFLATVGYEEPGSSDSYSWGITNEATVDELETFLRSLSRRRGLADSTINTKQARLAKYARVYANLYTRADFVARSVDPLNESAEYERVLGVFDELDRELSTDASKLRYHSDVSQFYDHLERRSKVAFNPAAEISKEFQWKPGDPDNPTLSADQVRQIYGAVESPSEELLVLALCAWGLRRSEVAALHVSQLTLEGDDPHIAFDESRKNGPGTVALIYGVHELVERVDTLGSQGRRWNGYLFPSSKSSSGYIVGETVQQRFQRIAKRAGVRVGGEPPTSKMGRRFWYTTYLEAHKYLLENLQAIAADQGSSDEGVVLKNYLSEGERRKYRQEVMRERLADAFEVNP